MEKVQNYLDIAITYSLERMSNENHLSIGPKRDCFSGGSAGKESTCDVGDLGLFPGWGRSPGEGKGYSLQYSGLWNSMDRGAWWATIHGVTESDMTE